MSLRYLIFMDPSLDLYTRILLLGSISLVGLGSIAFLVVWLCNWCKQHVAQLNLMLHMPLPTSMDHDNHNIPPCTSHQHWTCPHFFLHVCAMSITSEDFPLPMHSIPLSPVPPSLLAAMQPYYPPTCLPPAYQQHGAPSSATSSVWSSGALANVSNKDGITHSSLRTDNADALSMSSSISTSPLPHAGAEHGLLMLDPANEPKTYLFPLHDLPLDKDGNLQVARMNLSRQSLKQLKSLCTENQLPTSGTKPALQNHLIRFSDQGVAKWNAVLLPQAQIPHKACLLLMDQRLRTQEGQLDHAQPPYSIWNSKDKRMQANVDGLLLWANEIVAKLNVAGPPSCPLSHSHLPNNRQLPSMPIQVDGPEGLAAQCLLVSAMTVALKKALPGHLMAEADQTATIDQFMSMQEAPLNNFEDLMSESVTDSSVEAELPVKPPTWYGNNLDRLIPCWSDQNPYYNYPIVVKGVLTLIKYWRKMYLRMNGQWSELKSPWTKWKYLMESYEALTPIDFWKRYTNEETVWEAHAALGENLNKDFQYHRGKDVKMITRVWDIARLYREKCNGEDKENN
ncbi:hypothetical protein EDD18DRAFT_1106223 [Armillaria luteobubalina]|uniref:SAP domain-containing protein n=1 Tax=Armillaria luteobubalina TaxID=153913 RepID=A0AA39Q647_9AGAR|nr:hypothetical protein EDD18DRAFT_1106223 [Armillaria luteobubalina]